VTLDGEFHSCSAQGQGRQAVRKECDAAKLVRAIASCATCGQAKFQYRDNSGTVRASLHHAGKRDSCAEIAGIRFRCRISAP